MQETPVQSSVGELRSHVTCSQPNKQKEQLMWGFPTGMFILLNVKWKCKQGSKLTFIHSSLLVLRGGNLPWFLWPKFLFLLLKWSILVPMLTDLKYLAWGSVSQQEVRFPWKESRCKFGLVTLGFYVGKAPQHISLIIAAQPIPSTP